MFQNAMFISSSALILLQEDYLQARHLILWDENLPQKRQKNLEPMDRGNDLRFLYNLENFCTHFKGSSILTKDLRANNSSGGFIFVVGRVFSKLVIVIPSSGSEPLGSPGSCSCGSSSSSGSSINVS